MSVAVQGLSQGLIWIVITLTILIVAKLCAGKIRLAGALSSNTDGAVQVERIQMLGLSVAMAAAYVSHVLTEVSLVQTPLHTLPDVPDWILATFASSQGVYLVGKWVRVADLDVSIKLGRNSKQGGDNGDGTN